MAAIPATTNVQFTIAPRESYEMKVPSLEKIFVLKKMAGDQPVYATAVFRFASSEEASNADVQLSTKKTPGGNTSFRAVVPYKNPLEREYTLEEVVNPLDGINSLIKCVGHLIFKGEVVKQVNAEILDCAQD